jgi:O-acetyl-ADP-ribose deacetylase (regulator of RNase III)
MNNYNEVDGNLITLALEGKFDVISHGCNCFCTMGAGIAPHMAKAFLCDLFDMEHKQYRGDINKLGTIDYREYFLVNGKLNFNYEYHIKNEDQIPLYVVNSYTQYHYGRNHTDGVKTPIDYEALTLCMRKINNVFKNKHIGLPKIGAGLAGGDWNRIQSIIRSELIDCKVTIVIFK